MEENRTVSHVKVMLEVVIYQDRDAMNQWVAVCPTLRIATQDRTKLGAERALTEALHLWFETCIQEEILDNSLEFLGFNPISPDEAMELIQGGDPVNIIGVEERIAATDPRSLDHGLRFTVGHRPKGGQPFVLGEIPAALLRQQLEGRTLAR